MLVCSLTTVYYYTFCIYRGTDYCVKQPSVILEFKWPQNIFYEFGVDSFPQQVACITMPGL